MVCEGASQVVPSSCPWRGLESTRAVGESGLYAPQEFACPSRVCAHFCQPFQSAGTHTDVAAGCIPSASIGDLLALQQAHHPLEVLGVDDSPIVPGLLGVFPVELL